MNYKSFTPKILLHIHMQEAPNRVFKPAYFIGIIYTFQE